MWNTPSPRPLPQGEGEDFLQTAQTQRGVNVRLRPPYQSDRSVPEIREESPLAGGKVRRHNETMSKDSMHHLSADPTFAALIARVGPPRLGVERQRGPYEALVRAIAHQQLHGKAAQTILGRFEALFPPGAFPEPQAVLATSDEAMRGCGFSGSKVAAIRDICAKTIDGTVPTRRGAARLSDDALIERLVTIRGVGRWTVEMLLIFTLGRPDVLPVDDFGVREGYRVLYGLDEQPKPRALAELGLPWAPYRSFATWYLYRAIEEARRQAPVSRA